MKENTQMKKHFPVNSVTNNLVGLLIRQFMKESMQVKSHMIVRSVVKVLIAIQKYRKAENVRPRVWT